MVLSFLLKEHTLIFLVRLVQWWWTLSFCLSENSTSVGRVYLVVWFFLSALLKYHSLFFGPAKFLLKKKSANSLMGIHFSVIFYFLAAFKIIFNVCHCNYVSWCGSLLVHLVWDSDFWPWIPISFLRLRKFSVMILSNTFSVSFLSLLLLGHL